MVKVALGPYESWPLGEISGSANSTWEFEVTQPIIGSPVLHQRGWESERYPLAGAQPPLGGNLEVAPVADPSGVIDLPYFLTATPKSVLTASK